MKTLSTSVLIDAYKTACRERLDPAFITLLKKELSRREVNLKKLNA